MTQETRCILLFDSVHDVMRTERQLKDRGMWCDLVPTPRQLTSECGMSVEIQCRDADAALELLDRDSSIMGLYELSGEEVRFISKETQRRPR